MAPIVPSKKAPSASTKEDSSDEEQPMEQVEDKESQSEPVKKPAKKVPAKKGNAKAAKKAPPAKEENSGEEKESESDAKGVKENGDAPQGRARRAAASTKPNYADDKEDKPPASKKPKGRAPAKKGQKAAPPAKEEISEEETPMDQDENSVSEAVNPGKGEKKNAAKKGNAKAEKKASPAKEENSDEDKESDSNGVNKNGDAPQGRGKRAAAATKPNYADDKEVKPPAAKKGRAPAKKGQKAAPAKEELSEEETPMDQDEDSEAVNPGKGEKKNAAKKGNAHAAKKAPPAKEETPAEESPKKQDEDSETEIPVAKPGKSGKAGAKKTKNIQNIPGASSSDMKSKSVDSSHEVIDMPKPSTTYIAAAGDSYASKHSTAANDSFGSKHSGFETAGKSNEVTSPVKSGPVVSSKIKNLQNTLFQYRAVPKPGDKQPIRPVTTIIDNYNGPEDEENMVKESDSNDVKMSHPCKDRPKQYKRPPTMPVITSSDSTTSLSNGASNGVATTTNFPVKESPPVVTQKPLLPIVKTQHKSDNESKSSQKIHAETTLVPTKKAAAPSSSVSSASISTSYHISPLPYLSEDEKVTAKHYNHIAKAFNDLLKK